MSANTTWSGTPAAEHLIDAALVARLLADQHPDLAALPLQAVDAGWDNALFRLGDQLAVRLPRRAAAATLIAHEQRWLPHLANRLALPVPVPCRTGNAGRGYPWRWSIQSWLPGHAADLHPPAPAQAAAFAAFLRSLHRPAPPDAPINPVRGGRLRERAPFAEKRLGRLSTNTALISPQLWQLWQAALDAPLDGEPTWLHGDLHPRNVLTEQGSITGIIDWGDITAGDSATDLAAVWMLFDDTHTRRTAFAAYGECSTATLARARGWAIHLGAILLDSGLVDNSRHALIGEHTLRRVLMDD